MTPATPLLAARAELDRLKRERLIGIIRRVVADPHELDRVVDEIVEDWFPLMVIKPGGVVAISGRVVRR